MSAGRVLVAAGTALALQVALAPPASALPPAPVPAAAEQQGDLGPLPAGRVVTFTGTITEQGRVPTVKYPPSPQSLSAFPISTKSRPPDAFCGSWYTCHDWTLDVVADVPDDSRLRVAVDGAQGYPGNFDAVDLVVYPPDTVGAASTSTMPCVPPGPRDEVRGADIRYVSSYSLEAIFEAGRGPRGCDVAPRAGVYTLRVIGAQVAQDDYPADRDVRATYRGRAFLGRGRPASHSQPLLPNLVAPLPPWDVYLGCRSDEDPPGAPELQCLRYSFAYGNAGDGLLDLSFQASADTPTAVMQRIYRADTTPGHYEDNEYDLEPLDGVYASVHLSHRHWHLDDFHRAVLRPLDGKREEVAAKRGVCTSPWFLLDLERTDGDGIDAGSSEGCDTEHVSSLPTTTRIELPANWGDAYWSYQPDNMIDITTVDNGDHLLLFSVNPNGRIIESSTNDNHAYAVVRLSGGKSDRSVCIVERGYGTRPGTGKVVPPDGVASECPSNQ